MERQQSTLPTLSDQEIQKFHSLYTTGTNPEDCYEWQGGTRGGDVGFFLVKVNGKYVVLSAHRVAYFLHYGTDPGKTRIRRSCDNPKCVNPRHIVTKTEYHQLQPKPENVPGLAPPTEKDILRFYSKVICGLTPDECYQWTDHSHGYGYGYIGWK